MKRTFTAAAILLLLTYVISGLGMDPGLAASHGVEARLLRVSFLEWNDPYWFQLIETEIRDVDNIPIQIQSVTSSIEPVAGHGIEKLTDGKFYQNGEFVIRGTQETLVLTMDLGQVRTLKSLRVINDGQYGTLSLCVDSSLSPDGPYGLVGRFTGLTADARILNDNVLEFVALCRINEISTSAGSWIEFFNPGRMDYFLEGHVLETGGSSFTLGEIYVPGNDYLILVEGFGDDPGKIFTRMHFGWTDAEGGFCSILSPGGDGVDFVRWGNASEPVPGGTSFDGPVIALPDRGTTLGRNETSADTGRSSDFRANRPTLAAENILLFEISGMLIDSSAALFPGITVSINGVPAAFTDTDGRYLVKGIPRGSCTVSASKRGFIFSPQKRTIDVQGDAGGVNFLALPDPGSYLIAGYLLGPDGHGLGRVPILMLGTGQTVETNFDGYFSFMGMPRGSYGLTVVLDGYLVEPAAMLVEVARDRTDILFSASPNAEEYQVVGRITDGYSSPFRGVRVWAGDMIGVTDSEGYYAIENVRGTDIEVQPELEGHIFFPSTRLASPPGPVTADFTISTTNKCAVRCKVMTQTGLPFKGLEVKFESTFHTVVKFTGPDGYAFFHSLPSGTYTVTPATPGYSYLPAQLNLNLSNRNTAIQFIASPLTVSYAVEGSIFTPAGKPLMGAKVCLRAGSGEINSTYSDADGFYGFPMAPAGQLSVIPTLKNHTLAPTGRGIDLIRDMYGLDFIAKPRSDFMITGKVSDEFGLPVQGIRVIAGNPDGCIDPVSAVTDCSGAYGLGPYSAGIKRIEAGLAGYLVWPFRIDAEVGDNLNSVDFTARYEIFHPVTFTGKSFRIKVTRFGHPRYLQMNEITFFGNLPGRSTVMALPAAGVLCGTQPVPGYGVERLIDGSTEYNDDFSVVHDGNPVMIDIDLAGEFVIDRMVVSNDGEFGATDLEVWARTGPSDEWALLAEVVDLPLESEKVKAALILLGLGKVMVSELSDLDGGFVEIYNAGITRVDIRGYRLKTGGLDRALPNFYLAPSEMVALWSGTAVAGPGIIPLGTSLSFSSEGDFVCLHDPSGNPVDFVRWGTCWELPPSGTDFRGANPPVPTADFSLARMDPGTDTDDGIDWTLLPNSPGRRTPYEITLIGRVSDISGVSLEGAAVTLTTAGGAVRTTFSGPDGVFIIPGIPPARVSIVPFLPGFTFSPPFVSGLLLTDTLFLDFTGAPPPPGARLEGIVNSPSGVPVPGVSISSPGLGSAVTGISGKWILSVAMPGNYRIEPWAPGKSFTPSYQVSSFDDRMILSGVSVRADFTGQTIELPMKAKGRITDGGLPVPGVRVYLRSNGSFAETGTDGWYELSLPEGGGPHALTPGKAGYRFNPAERSFFAFGPVSGVDFTASPAYSIGGKALDRQGTGIPGAVITFSDGVTMETTGAGTFFRDGIGAGSGWMSIAKTGYLFDGPSRNFTLPPSIVSIDFLGRRPEQTFIFGGLVTYLSGDPAVGIKIDFHDTSGKRVAGAATGIDGTFAVSGFSAGVYTVIPVSGNHSFDPVSFSHALSADYRGLVFTSQRLYTISGTTRLGSGIPLPGATITLDPGGVVKQSGANGAFSFQRLRKGSYSLTASMQRYSFEPVSRTITLEADAGGKDFNASLEGSGLVLRVDSRFGSDFNPGTTERPFKTLAWAASAAGQGDTIFLAPGTYQGGVAMPFGVSLIGSGADVTVLDGGGRSFVLQTSAQSSVEGLTITNRGLAPGSRGILCGTDTRVSNCLVTGCGDGITLIGFSPQFGNVTVWGNTAAGVRIVNSSGAGFDSCVLQGFTVMGTHDFFISHSLVADGSAGIWWGTGVIAGDPLFFDFPAPCFPGPGSPCIDSGNPSSGKNDTDGSGNDMGYMGGPGHVSGRILIRPVRAYSDLPALDGFGPMAAADGDKTLSGGFAAALSGPGGQAASCRLDFELPGTFPLRSVRILCPVSVGADTLLVYSGSGRNVMTLAGAASLHGESAGQIEFIFEFRTVEGRFIGVSLMNFRDSLTVMVNEVSVTGTTGTSPESLPFMVTGNFVPWPGYGFGALSDSAMTFNGDFAALRGNEALEMILDLGSVATVSGLTVWNDGAFGARSVEVGIGVPGSWTPAGRFPLVAVGSSPIENRLELPEGSSRYLRLVFSDYGDFRWFQLNEILITGIVEGVERVGVASASANPAPFPGYGVERLIDGRYAWNDDFAVKDPGSKVTVVLDLGSDREISRLVHYNDGEFGGIAVTVFVAPSSLPQAYVEAGFFTGLGSSPGRTNRDVLDFPAITGRRVRLEYTVFSNARWFQINEIEAFMVSQAGSEPLKHMVSARVAVSESHALAMEGSEGRLHCGTPGSIGDRPYRKAVQSDEPRAVGNGSFPMLLKVRDDEFIADSRHLVAASMGAIVEVVTAGPGNDCIPDSGSVLNLECLPGDSLWSLPTELTLLPERPEFGDLERFCVDPWLEPVVPIQLISPQDSMVVATGWLVMSGAVLRFRRGVSAGIPGWNDYVSPCRVLGARIVTRSNIWTDAVTMAAGAIEMHDLCRPPEPLSPIWNFAPGRDLLLSIVAGDPVTETVLDGQALRIAGYLIGQPGSPGGFSGPQPDCTGLRQVPNGNAWSDPLGDSLRCLVFYRWAGALLRRIQPEPETFR